MALIGAVKHRELTTASPAKDSHLSLFSSALKSCIFKMMMGIYLYILTCHSSNTMVKWFQTAFTFSITLHELHTKYKHIQVYTNTCIPIPVPHSPGRASWSHHTPLSCCSHCSKDWYQAASCCGQRMWLQRTVGRWSAW